MLLCVLTLGSGVSIVFEHAVISRSAVPQTHIFLGLRYSPSYETFGNKMDTTYNSVYNCYHPARSGFKKTYVKDLNRKI